MDQKAAQTKLEALYTDWRSAIRFSKEEVDSLGAPLLLQLTDDYCIAKRRVLLLGQETYGWQWNSKLSDNPKWTYPDSWKFSDIYSCRDFQVSVDSIEALCWAYREFKFGKHQPSLSRTPFWRAFREVASWPDTGMMWSNVVRMDYSPPGGTASSLSIWRAMCSLRTSLIAQQASMMRDELAILDPHVCLFFSGPNYDDFIRVAFPNCKFEVCGEAPVRGLARLVHDALPPASFRTYHPKFLSQGRRWHYIEALRTLIYKT